MLRTVNMSSATQIKDRTLLAVIGDEVRVVGWHDPAAVDRRLSRTMGRRLVAVRLLGLLSSVSGRLQRNVWLTFSRIRSQACCWQA